MKKLKTFSIITICSLFIVELITRYCGLHQYPLFIESREFEYIHKPNQLTKIYGNRFKTNEYSMRSESINRSDTTIVLLIGDSVLNGGNTIDQDELASTILEKELNEKLIKHVKVLNISSYTWSPDNIYAYLKKYGTFNADLIVYICNSGDAYDPMTFEQVVGVSDTHMKNNYYFGTLKLINKVLSILKTKFSNKIKISEYREEKLTIGFSKIDSAASKLRIPLMIYIHPDINEVSNKQYNDAGKMIINYYNSKNRKIIKELYLGVSQKYYKDDIHFNAAGQEFMAKKLLLPVYNYIR